MFFAILSCTRSNISLSMIAGIPSGVTTSRYLYSPIYFLLERIILTPLTLNFLPFRVLSPLELSSSQISLIDSPLSYRVKISIGIAAVIGSIKIFCSLSEQYPSGSVPPLVLHLRAFSVCPLWIFSESSAE